MWKKVNRKKIDEDKYSECLQSAINYKVYAELWLLDSLMEKNWYCYVWGDYMAIMPVCYDKKFLMTRIIQPTFCQQLGIFYREGLTQEIFDSGLALLRKNYLKSYSFNDQNTLKFEFKGKTKKNFLLKLKDGYEALEKDFNKNTKRNLKKAITANLVLKKSKDIHALLGLKRGDKEEILSQFTKMANAALAQNKGEVWEAYSPDNQLMGAFFLLHSENYLTYTLAGSSDAGKDNGAMTFLVNELIKENALSNKILDFEGSQTSGVARFYKGFGGKNIEYKLV